MSCYFQQRSVNVKIWTSLLTVSHHPSSRVADNALILFRQTGHTSVHKTYLHDALRVTYLLLMFISNILLPLLIQAVSQYLGSCGLFHYGGKLMMKSSMSLIQSSLFIKNEYKIPSPCQTAGDRFLAATLNGDHLCVFRWGCTWVPCALDQKIFHLQCPLVHTCTLCLLVRWTKGVRGSADLFPFCRLWSETESLSIPASKSVFL